MLISCEVSIQASAHYVPGCQYLSYYYEGVICIPLVGVICQVYVYKYSPNRLFTPMMCLMKNS